MVDSLRTDIDAIPTDGTPVLIGTLKGEILISRFIKPTRDHPRGRWPGIASTDWPIAWAHVPSHPYFSETRRVLSSGEKVKP